MITQRAVLLGFVGFCFYLIALVNSLPGFYYALTWLAVGMLVSSLGVAMLSLVAVKCRWKIAQSRTTESVEGQAVQGGPVLNVYLENGGTLNKTGLLLEVRLRPVRNRNSQGQAGRKVPLLSRKILVETLPSGTSMEATIPLIDVPRGRYRVEDLRLTGSDVLGLFRARRRLLPEKEVAEQDIVVGPAVLSLNQSAWRERNAGQLPGEIEARFQVGQGDELRGIRPYTPGDDLRQVHWTSTARLGQLVVKEFHHRGRGAALIVWDGADGVDWGNGEAEEWGLRLTASLANALSGVGAPCVVARLDSDPAILEGLKSDALFGATVETLADAHSDRSGGMLSQGVSFKGPFEQVFIVTASLSPDLSEAVARLGRIGGAGSRVTVGLINGYLLGKAMGDRRFTSRARSVPQQKSLVEEGGKSKTASVPVTGAAYREQIDGLRKTGARVVMVEPGPADGGSYHLLPLARALKLMVSGGEIPDFVDEAPSVV